jgi:hypothetical protein
MSCTPTPDPRPTSTDLSRESPLSFAALPDIENTPFALHAPVLDRAALQRTLLSEHFTIAYGDPCSEELLADLSIAVQRTSTSFYTMLNVDHEDVRCAVDDWLAGNPLGEISKGVKGAIANDICRDALTFMDAIGVTPITIRLILEHESGCSDFARIDAESMQCSDTLEKLIHRLFYDASFLFHCDEDMANQIKPYVEAPTIALDTADVRREPTFDDWINIFWGSEPTLLQQAEQLLDQRDTAGLTLLGQRVEEQIAKFQLTLPGLVLPGCAPYRMLQGRPHLYFGAQEKIEGKLGIAGPKGLLHARPAIWAQERNAKRFVVIMDSREDIELEDLLR